MQPIVESALSTRGGFVALVMAIILGAHYFGTEVWAERPSQCKAQSADFYTETIPNTLVKFDMARIPGGHITLPEPENHSAERRIRIKPFWMGRTEVTWDEYDVFLLGLDKAEEDESCDADAISRPSKPYGAIDRGFGRKGYPVISVSYYAAKQYCKWLSAITGNKYRLPTEAEWEYACRADAPEPDKDKLKEVAWFWQEKTQPVRKKSPNAWGLYDILGNVAEWATDLRGKPVLCGGSFEDMAQNVRPSSRAYQDESWQATDPQDPKSKWWLTDAPFAGFRVVRED